MRWTREQLAALPPGVQPEQHDRLLCRYCGAWYRSLGHHLVGPRHRVSLDAYREAFELPATRPLMAADLREGHARRGRELFDTNDAVREAFAVDQPLHPERERRRIRGLQRKAETASRAGVQASKQAVGVQLAASSRRRAERRRADLDQLATALGYTDLTQLLHATTELTNSQLGQLLDMTPDTAHSWRRKEGIRSQAKPAAARHRATAPAPGTRPPGDGMQPTDAQGRPTCLQCGTSWTDLGKHVEEAHQLSQHTYRLTHGLALEVSLRSADHERQSRDNMAAIGRASAQQRRDRVRAGYDRQAQAVGYDTVVDLLTANPNPDVERLLGLQTGYAARLRRRYHPASATSLTPQAGAQRRQDMKAQDAGYPDLVSLLRDCTTAQVLELLEVSKSQACRLRRQYLPGEEIT